MQQSVLGERNVGLIVDRGQRQDRQLRYPTTLVASNAGTTGCRRCARTVTIVELWGMWGAIWVLDDTTCKTDIVLVYVFACNCDHVSACLVNDDYCRRLSMSDVRFQSYLAYSRPSQLAKHSDACRLASWCSIRSSELIERSTKMGRLILPSVHISAIIHHHQGLTT